MTKSIQETIYDIYLDYKTETVEDVRLFYDDLVAKELIDLPMIKQEQWFGYWEALKRGVDNK